VIEVFRNLDTTAPVGVFTRLDDPEVLSEL